MARIIRCECGFVAQADSDDAVVAQIREHMQQDHPALRDAVGLEEIRGWIEMG
jgi:predicted small metal-binding protein